MEKLKLIKPTKDFEKKVFEMVQEFFDDNTTPYGSSWLKNFLDDYDGRLNYLKQCENEDTITSWHVPANQYILVREFDNSVIWFVSARLRLNEWLLRHWWHIWYSIRPKERMKHFATAQLFTVLDIYKNLWVEKVLLTCNKENIWSAKTIQNCWWILENEIIDPNDWELIQRYRIDVKEWIEKWKIFYENIWINIEIL